MSVSSPPLFYYNVLIKKYLKTLHKFLKTLSYYFTPVPQKKPSGYQEEHEIMKAGSSHLLRIQPTVSGLLPTEEKDG